VDLNRVLHQHQAALALQERAAKAEERRAYCQFARDYSVQIQTIRTKSGAPKIITGFPN